MPITHTRRLLTAVTLLAVAASAPTAAAQQILEVDLSAGRTIIDDQWRSMGSIILAVDHDRGILYVNDAEEPEGIMAFSLAVPNRRSDGKGWVGIRMTNPVDCRGSDTLPLGVDARYISVSRRSITLPLTPEPRASQQTEDHRPVKEQHGI